MAPAMAGFRRVQCGGVLIPAPLRLGVLQVPLFAEMPTMEHQEAVLFCARAALGNVLTALFAF